MRKSLFFILLFSVWLIFPAGCGWQTPEDSDEIGSSYLNAAAYKDGFIAVGSNGRMEFISISGDIETIHTPVGAALLDISVSQDNAVAVGEEGAILLLQEDGAVSQLKTDCKETLHSVCVFKNMWFAGGDSGVLLYSDDLERWQSIELPLEGAITGLAADGERCIGVTDDGEILVSTDGMAWEMLDYNQYYGQEISFQGIELCDNMFYAFGVNAEGASQMLMSLEGGVWSDRDLEVYQNGIPDGNTPQISGICWDGQQIIAACPDGRVLTLPSCTQCNTVQEVSDKPLYSVAFNSGKLLFAGQDCSIQILDTEAVRQYNIKPQAALEKQGNGALIIDVRSLEEYNEKHIAQSVNLELALVESELESLCPDKERELIFYCAAGVRSQKALETALELGYENVCNLGSIDDWCYELEGGE